MGRDCGMIALGTAYGQPDIILVPESPVDPDPLVERVLRHPRHPEARRPLRLGRDRRHQGPDPRAPSPRARTPPATSSTPGPPRRSSACWSSGSATPSSPASAATRAPTPPSSSERSATPSAAGGRSSSTGSTPRSSAARPSSSSLQGFHNCVATLQYRDGGFVLDSIDANKLRDRWGTIHARPLSPTLYDPKRFQPSAKGIEYLRSIFTNALGVDDVECIRRIFNTGNLTHPYASVNVDITKRIRRLDARAELKAADRPSVRCPSRRRRGFRWPPPRTPRRGRPLAGPVKRTLACPFLQGFTTASLVRDGIVAHNMRQVADAPRSLPGGHDSRSPTARCTLGHRNRVAPRVEASDDRER